MRITQQELKKINRSFMELPHEVCGNVLEDHNGDVFLFGTVKGKTDPAGRIYCTVTKYSRINFHSHPNIEKSYPSAEDILSIMKQRPIRIDKEVLFTKWGVWLLSADHKREFTRDEQIAHLHTLTAFGDDLYHRTRRGRADISDLSMRDIDSFIHNVKTAFRFCGLEILFFDWNVREIVL